MYSVTRLLDVVEDERDRILGELRSAAADAGALRWVVQPTLPGVRNGGDILLHSRFDAKNHSDCASKKFDALLADPEEPLEERRRRPDDVVDRCCEEADRPVERPTRPLRRVPDEDEDE